MFYTSNRSGSLRTKTIDKDFDDGIYKEMFSSQVHSKDEIEKNGKKTVVIDMIKQEILISRVNKLHLNELGGAKTEEGR